MKQNTELQERLAVHAMGRLPTVARQMWFQLDYHFHARHFSPSYRYLASGSGCSVGSVRGHLRRLEREQIVMLFDGSRRAIRLLLRFPLPDSVSSGYVYTPWMDVPLRSFLAENSPSDERRATLVHASLGEPTQRVWYHLDRFMEQNGVVPTHEELAETCGYTRSAARYRLKCLRRAGVIQRVYKWPRAIRLLLRYPEQLRDQPFPPHEASKPGPGPRSRLPIDFV